MLSISYRKRVLADWLRVLLAAAVLFAGLASAQTSIGLNKKFPVYQNPVYDSDFPDPTVIRASDGSFYAYATQTTIAGVWYNIQVARSADLLHWQFLGEGLPVK